MAHSFDVPEPWRSRGWKLKIRDRERLEPPHVTLLLKQQYWRYSLRDGVFLDREPNSAIVPAGLVKHIRANSDEYIVIWDDLYPGNPVRDSSEEE